MNGPNSRLLSHESLICYHPPLSLEEEAQKFLTWPMSESSPSVYFANSGTVNFDGHFPLGSKTFPFTHLESSDYSLLNQKLQAGRVEHIICKRLAKEGGLGLSEPLPQSLLTLNSANCPLGMTWNVSAIHSAWCLQPGSKWVSYHLPKTLTKQPYGFSLVPVRGNFK